MNDAVLTKAKRQSIKRNAIKKAWHMRALYLMMAPALLYYIIYRIVPIYGVIIAFKDYNLTLGILNSPWANPLAKHFISFVQSPYFVQLLSNTILISLYKLAFGMIPPILFALMLNECKVNWLKKTAQTLSYMPHFLSWIIIYGIVLLFFSESTGIINRLIPTGNKPFAVLTSTRYFRSMLVITSIWKDLGWSAIIYLAAITGIDTTLYEAAHIDGAGRIRSIWNITLPSIRNTIVLLLILRLGHILDAGFDQIYVMYNIRVYPVADIIDTWVYRTGLQQLNFSLSSAVGLFKSIIGMILIISTNYLSGKLGERIW